MKYDVFISYSRKDMATANALCSLLDKAGVNYWIDRNIHGSANFLTEITHNIRQCRVVIFLASEHSAKSEWTQKEILFALKHHKQIIPYRIAAFSFEENDELDFVFTNVQWISSEHAVLDSLRALGCVPEPKATTTPSQQPKTYRVGDYYDDGTKRGVVFEVSDGGRHGKIVSLEQSEEDELQWCTDDEYDRAIETGASDEENGLNNQRKIQQISAWREKYPAFAWCADRGEGWYLPAIEELKQFALNDAVHETVNRTLEAVGGERIYDCDDLAWYWSSTEADYKGDKGWKFCAWSAGLSGGESCDRKSNYGSSARAVAAF